MTMKFKTALAAAALVGLSGPAMAQAVGCAAASVVCDDDDSIVVEVTVAELIEVVVTGAGLYSVSTNDLSSPTGTNTRGDEAGRASAEFEVRSNTRYDLLIEPTTGTWVADNYGIPGFEQIKFVRAGNADQWIGGELIVDPTPGVSTSGANSGEARLSGPDGVITEFTNQPAGVNDYAVGANFVPSLFADTTNPTGNTNRVAPPGRYFTNARITATVR